MKNYPGKEKMLLVIKKCLQKKKKSFEHGNKDFAIL